MMYEKKKIGIFLILFFLFLKGVVYVFVVLEFFVRRLKIIMVILFMFSFLFVRGFEKNFFKILLILVILVLFLWVCDG